MIEEEREGSIGRLGLSSTKRHEKNILFLLQTQQARWSSRGEEEVKKVKLSSSNNILTIRRATGLRSIEEPEAYTPAGGGFGFGVA